MSLILDALKKSEAERQRNAGPTLLDVRIARPQRRYPIWAFIVGGLLLVNMVLLLIFVLRRPSSDVTVAVNRLNPSAQPATSPAPALATPPSAAPAAIVGAATTPSTPANATTTSAAQAPLPADEPADDSPMNPADDLPALSGPAAAQRSGGGSVKYQHDDSGGYSSLPSYTELSGNLPPLRLDLHVYAEQPRNRYAMINMQAVHEGDTLSEGMRVLAITRDGVALDYRGQQFMLHPQ